MLKVIKSIASTVVGLFLLLVLARIVGGAVFGGAEHDPRATPSAVTPPPPTPARSFTLAVPPPDEMRTIDPSHRLLVETANGLCREWLAQTDADAQRAFLRTQPVRDLLGQRGRSFHLVGMLVDRDIARDTASASIYIGGGVVLSTAGVGFLSTDVMDTRLQRGTPAFAGLLNTARDDIVVARVEPLALMPGARCDVLTRIRTLSSMGAMR